MYIEAKAFANKFLATQAAKQRRRWANPKGCRVPCFRGHSQSRNVNPDLPGRESMLPATGFSGWRACFRGPSV